MIQFSQPGDLQALEIDFDDYKVPKLGSKAYIDTQSDVDKDRFIKQYSAKKKEQGEKPKQENAQESETSRAQKKVEEEQQRIEQLVR